MTKNRLIASPLMVLLFACAVLFSYVGREVFRSSAQSESTGTGIIAVLIFAFAIWSLVAMKIVWSTCCVWENRSRSRKHFNALSIAILFLLPIASAAYFIIRLWMWNK